MIPRKFVVLLSLVAVVLLAVSAPAALAQEAQASYSPDGAWLAVANMPGGAQVLFMDIYTSNPTAQGQAGTVLCTLSVPAFATPYGKMAMTASGHGNWRRINKNHFVFTVLRILVDADPANATPDGAPTGMVKFRGSITATGPSTFEGTMTADYYDLEGKLFLSFSFTTAGRRIAVETE
jgi:hypothetical protein